MNVRRLLASLGTLTLLWLAQGRAASAEPETFVRLDQTTWLGRYEFAASYSLEAKSQLKEYQVAQGGGGGGGGLGGRQSYDGVTHRLWSGFGVTRWLSVSVDHTFGQADLQDLTYKNLVLQVRGHFGRIFKNLPVEVDGFAESRVRLNARRRPSVVLGIGVARAWGKLRLAANVGFETTVEPEHRENGMRYEVGFSYRPWRFMTIAVEGWGSLVWPTYAVFQHDHHAGPSLMFRVGRVWIGASAGFGAKRRPAKVFVDVSSMGKLGVQF